MKNLKILKKKIGYLLFCGNALGLSGCTDRYSAHSMREENESLRDFNYEEYTQTIQQCAGLLNISEEEAIDSVDKITLELMRVWYKEKNFDEAITLANQARLHNPRFAVDHEFLSIYIDNLSAKHEYEAAELEIEEFKKRTEVGDPVPYVCTAIVALRRETAERGLFDSRELLIPKYQKIIGIFNTAINQDLAKDEKFDHYIARSHKTIGDIYMEMYKIKNRDSAYKHYRENAKEHYSLAENRGYKFTCLEKFCNKWDGCHKTLYGLLIVGSIIAATIVLLDNQQKEIHYAR